MFVHFGGNGQIVVSLTEIRSHTANPERHRAFDDRDAVRLTRLAWKDEHCYVELERPEEHEQFCRVLDAQVRRDFCRDPFYMG
jgi:hypothetical protein